MRRQAFELVRRGPPLPQWLYQHLNFDGPFTVRADETHSFRMMSGAHVENELFWRGLGGSWEGASLRIWTELCRDRTGLICDIGANTGAYSLAAAAFAPKARIAAFEPVERLALRLQQNVDLNRFAIDVERMAVSRTSGAMTIYDDQSEHNYSASLEGQGPDASAYTVTVCALDDYVVEHGVRELGPIKIDVERHEPAAIAGMLNSLAKYKPALLIEILDADVGEDVQALVESIGYRKFHIHEEHGLIPAATLEPIHAPHWNQLMCSQQDYDRARLDRFLART